MPDAIRHAADHTAAVRMAAEHNSSKLFGNDEINHVIDVGFQVDLWRQQMLAIAKSCKALCENVMAERLQ